jgi:hypothetical protein
MSDFARQQSEFQRGILAGDDTVLAEILDGPREKRDVLFGVYAAYACGWSSHVRNDHELLHPISVTMFDEMGYRLRQGASTEHRTCAGSRKPADFPRSNAPTPNPKRSDPPREKALNDLRCREGAWLN